MSASSDLLSWLRDRRRACANRIVPLSDGRCRIVYRTEVSGSHAADFGAAITTDFGAVLAALKATAEAG